MSDMSEPTYRVIDYCAKRLKEEGIAFDSRDRGTHFVVTHNTLTADFYPVSGRFTVRQRKGAKPKPTDKLTGVEALIKYLGGN